LAVGLYKFEVNLEICTSLGNSWGIITGVTSNSADFNANIRMTGGGYIGFTGHRTNGNSSPSDIDFGQSYGQGDLVRCELAVQHNSAVLTFFLNDAFQGAMTVDSITDCYIGISVSSNVVLKIREV